MLSLTLFQQLGLSGTWKHQLLSFPSTPAVAYAKNTSWLSALCKTTFFLWFFSSLMFRSSERPHPHTTQSEFPSSMYGECSLSLYYLSQFIMRSLPIDLFLFSCAPQHVWSKFPDQWLNRAPCAGSVVLITGPPVKSLLVLLILFLIVLPYSKKNFFLIVLS